MSERTNPFRNIRFIVRPGPRKLKLVFLALILACTAALVALGVVRGQIRAQTQQALDRGTELAHENAELTEKQADPGSSRNIREFAREVLGLVDPGTVLMEPNS